MAGWKEDSEQAVQLAKTVEPITRAGVMYYAYAVPTIQRVLKPNDGLMQEIVETFSAAEQSGEDVALGLAQSNLGIALVFGDSDARGFELLAEVREASVEKRHSRTAIPLIDVILAQDRIQRGDLDRAIDLARAALEELLVGGGMMWVPPAANVLTEALLQRGDAGDIEEARAVIDRLATVKADPGLVMYEIWQLRMRALLARAIDDEVGYRNYRDRYRKMARELGFEGHIEMAEAMPSHRPGR